jgi:hypothetical protein
MRIKITFLLCFTFCSALAFGGSDIVVQYKIVSDKIDTSLTPGTCLVIGTVSHRKKVVANGLVGSTIGANDTKTDSLG